MLAHDREGSAVQRAQEADRRVPEHQDPVLYNGVPSVPERASRKDGPKKH